MFDHYADKLISIRLNSDGEKVKDKESAETIGATLWDVDIYRKDGKLTKAVEQCTNFGEVGVT